MRVFNGFSVTIHVSSAQNDTWTEEIEIEDAAHLERLKRRYHPDCVA